MEKESWQSKLSGPWSWVPTLYIFEGLPYFVVNTVSVIILKRLGLGNADIAVYTGLLYLPWVIKPLWSPFVDILRTKRWWITAMQLVMALAVACAAFFINSDIVAKNWHFFALLGAFWITAFASATHDIAADGFYMIALDEHKSTQFVGIRNTFYRIASVFGQGVLVMFAGMLETHTADIPASWKYTMLATSAILMCISLWHIGVLPRPRDDENRFAAGKDGKDGKCGASAVAGELINSFSTFFGKKGILCAIFFMLLYRLPEAFTVKMINPFFLDARPDGGLGMTTEQVGLAYGTCGAVSLIAGGIFGGLAAGKWGLKRCIWPMALSLTLPCIAFVFLAQAQPLQLWPVFTAVCVDQFGYGFGFTAYTLYMMYFSRGRYRTSHYSLCTAFMALSMMLPGMVAGYLQEWLGYRMFFWMIVLCFAATFLSVVLVWNKIDSEYGKKTY